MLALSGILLKKNRKDTTGDSPSCWLPGKLSSAFLNWPFVSTVPECHRAEATFHSSMSLPFSCSVLYYCDEHRGAGHSLKTDAFLTMPRTPTGYLVRRETERVGGEERDRERRRGRREREEKERKGKEG